MSAKRGRASTTCTPASNAVSCRRHVSFCSCRLCQSVDVVGETLEGFGSGVRERGVYPSCGGGRDLLRRGLCCHRSVLVGGDGELCRHAICCFSSTSCRRRSRFCLCSSSLDSSPSAAVVVLLLFCLCNERSNFTYLPILLFLLPPFFRLALPFRLRLGAVGCGRARPLPASESVTRLGLASHHRLPLMTHASLGTGVMMLT